MHLQFDGLWILRHADGCFLQLSLTDLLLAIISLHVLRHHIVRMGYERTRYTTAQSFVAFACCYLLNHLFFNGESFLQRKLRESLSYVEYLLIMYLHQFVPNCYHS